jgi:hypothetical protein
MQITREDAAAVLEVGEEHPDSVKKTMRGRWRPTPRRRLAVAWDVIGRERRSRLRAPTSQPGGVA